MTEDEMVGWHHQFNGHEFEQAPGDSEGQKRLVCCSSWGHRVRYDLATEQKRTMNPRYASPSCNNHQCLFHPYSYYTQ